MSYEIKCRLRFERSIAKRGVRLLLEVEVGLGRPYKAVLHIRCSTACDDRINHIFKPACLQRK